jgi:lipopolysaccharide transport system ATP-binding protein
MSESDIILTATNISKQYRLGELGTKSLSGDFHRWWTTRILKKEDPYLQVGIINDRTSKVKTDFVWALKDINFDVKRGEVLGIIGKNGAGKSTLLKLLSRITTPTTGNIRFSGRLASLLEVGTGFHPELTGRENIYLNGSIMGMTKKEINRKFDEIVEFSGCALYIDTPVKRYSSGMSVRLGFAVAAFLEPEILVVDEVLAVGDAEFQRKAIGKMQEVSTNDGRTVLFVSHNMDAVSKLCNRLMIIEKGTIAYTGSVSKGIQYYLNDNVKVLKINTPTVINKKGSKLSINDIAINSSSLPSTGNPIELFLNLRNITNENLINVRISVGFYIGDSMKYVLDNSICNYQISFAPLSNQIIRFNVYEFPLGPSTYQLYYYFEVNGEMDFYFDDYYFDCISNQVFGATTTMRSEWPSSLTYTKFTITTE